VPVVAGDVATGEAATGDGEPPVVAVGVDSLELDGVSSPPQPAANAVRRSATALARSFDRVIEGDASCMNSGVCVPEDYYPCVAAVVAYGSSVVRFKAATLASA
jgi:hypothetical protein